MKLGLEAGAETLDLAVELGIKGVPIWLDPLAAEGVEKTLAPLRERGLLPCQIGAFGYNPLSADKAGQAAQAAALEKVIPLAAQTGCPYIVIGPGNYHPSGFGVADARNFTETALDEMARGLAAPLALAEKHGVRLSIEAYLKGCINSPERFLALWGRLKTNALCCNIDPSSLYDFRDMVDPRGVVERDCSLLAGHYGLVHIKEFAMTEGVHIHAGFAPLGKGATDWVQMLRLIAPHVPADSWVLLEHCLTPQQAREDFAYLRSAAAEAGVTLA